MNSPDFGRTAADYSRHRAGFPDELYQVFGEIGIDLAGASAVDLGTGTGSLARGMARRNADVTGVDPSRELTGEAARLDLEWGVSIRYVRATAEQTGLESDAFDIVTSGQSWWWFDADAALAEAWRILKPTGWLVICSFDWIPLPGSVVELTESLIQRHNPSWDMGGGTGHHPEFVSNLEGGGFTSVSSAFRPVDVSYTQEAWRGRTRASAGIGASLDSQAVERFDAEHAAALGKIAGSGPVSTPHGLYVAAGRKPS